MSFAISGSSALYQPVSGLDSDAAPKPPAKPTVAQELHQLASAGQSSQQIATALGLTVAQVEQSLGETTTTTAAASTAIALAGKLSIQV